RRRGRVAAAGSPVGEPAVAVAEGAAAAGDRYPVHLASGCWLSRLERCVHIAEVAGSNPAQPTRQYRGVVNTRACCGDRRFETGRVLEHARDLPLGRRATPWPHEWRNRPPRSPDTRPTVQCERGWAANPPTGRHVTSSRTMFMSATAVSESTL